MQTDFADSITVRLECVKAAIQITPPREGIGNVLVSARWLESYVLTGRSPELADTSTGDHAG